MEAREARESMATDMTDRDRGPSPGPRPVAGPAVVARTVLSMDPDGLWNHGAGYDTREPPAYAPCPAQSLPTA